MARRFKPPVLEIPADAPFKHDLLEREQSAEVLTQFVSRLDEPFVLAIDSPWGSGKTTFLKMWLRSLQNRGFPCLYFNAWQNDFSDSPLVSLIGEIGDG
jgi:predicted AAA+ superfamily ATPase